MPLTAPVFADQNHLSCYVGRPSALTDFNVYHLTIFSYFKIRKGKSKNTFMNISTDKTTPVSINRNFVRKQLMPLTIFSVAQSITLSSLPEFLHLPRVLRYSSDPFVFDQICKEELSVHFPHISQGRTKFPSCFWN